MKLRMIFIMNILAINLIIGQNGSLNEPGKIVVIGYAEEDITPDQIFYKVELSEYRKGKEIIKLATLEESFWNIIKVEGIAKERVELDENKSRKIYYRRKHEEVLRTKKYEIKFSKIEDLDRFSKKLETIPISRAWICDVKISNIKSIRDSLKIEALKDGKIKAEKMLAAIDEELGRVVEVKENLDELISHYYENYYSQEQASMMSKYKRGYLSNEDLEHDKYSYDAEVSFKKIKLKSTVRVEFEIK